MGWCLLPIFPGVIPLWRKYMNIATAATTELDPVSVADIYEHLIDDLGGVPDFLVIYCSEGYAIDEVVAKIRSRSPETALHGGTSCLGAMTQLGLASEDGQGLAMLGIADSLGSYGVGVSAIGDDPTKAAEEAIEEALRQADCPGEVPAMVWLTAAPGSEEALIQGIGNILGEDVPVAGGSSADNSVSGGWKQIANDGVFDNSIVVTALFPSTDVLFAFHSGYEPTEAKGIITKAGGFVATDNKGIATETSKRLLIEIDGRPAAEVYNDWIGGGIAAQVDTGGNILQQTTLHPLGRVAGYIGDVPYYQLSHPESVTDDGAITMFSDIGKGDEIVLMQGTLDSLISRAGRVAVSALETNMTDAGGISGALIVYCAGCMLTVGERLDEVVESFRSALPGVPFLGTFTFGEQGCFLNGVNRHGNLMISVLLFTKEY